MNHRLNRAAVAALCTTLAACGGGGGDDGSGTQVTVPTGTRSVAASSGADLTAGNAVAVGASVAEAVRRNSSNGLVGVAAAEPRMRAQAGTDTAAGAVAWRAVRLAARTAGAGADGSTAARMQPAAVSTETERCANGGTLVVSFDDVDNNQRPSAGDSVSSTLNNCAVESGLPAANGSFRFTFNAVELDSQNNLVAFDASVSFTAFEVVGFGTLDGSGRLWLRTSGSAETARESFLRATLTVGGRTELYDFDVLSTTGSTSSRYDMSGGLVVNGQTYSMVPVTTFESTSNDAPASGAVELRDAAGDRLVLTARSVQAYDLALFPAGSSTASFTQTGLRWAPAD